MVDETLINEGGINWTWFTRIRMEPDDTVTILEHYRKHNDEEFTNEEKNAPRHPEYYGRDIWEEQEEGRIAIRYNVPGLGWKTISNPKYIFGYQKEEPITQEEARGIIEQIGEEKKSAMDIFSIVSKKSEEKFAGTYPEYFAIRERIYEEDLFGKLRDKLNEKKKTIDYENPRSEKAQKVRIDIQTLEQSLYDAYNVPLFKFGLGENLSKGFDWLVDEIILSYARFNEDVRSGEQSAQNLWPSEKGYGFSEDAKEFSDFLRTERDDYKIFAIEFIRQLCGEQ